MISTPAAVLWILCGAILAVLVPAIIHYGMDIRLSDKSKKPHVLFILVDDLGFNDVSWNNPMVRTPTLQKLTETGVVLNQYYALPLCTPSRTALLTGMYPHHVGSQNGVLLPAAPTCTAKGRKLLPQELKDLGYSTYMAGKWHIGFCNRNCTPTHRGFDRFSGFYQGFVDNYKHTTGPGFDWHEDENVDFSGQGTYSTELITSRVVEMIKNHDINKPSFTYVSYGATHTPLEAPQKFKDYYRNLASGFRQTFLGMVSAIDESVRVIIETLKERNMYDDTVIIFSSDNGAEFIGEEIGGSNHPLRGAKGTLYEGGTRVPAFLHSPKLASHEGYRHDGILHISDWYSTIVRMAGGNVSSSVDSIDQSKMLLHGTPSARTELVYNIDQSPIPLFGSKAIRVGNYKLIWGYPGPVDGWERDGNLCTSFQKRFLLGDGGTTGTAAELLKTDNRGLIDYRIIMSTDNVAPYSDKLRDHIMLFNLKDDPQERNNLADSMPEKVAEMKHRLEEMTASAVPPTPEMLQTDPAGLAQNHNWTWVPGWC